MYYILASTKKPVIRRNLQTRVKYLHKHGLFPRRKVFSFPALTFPVSSSIIMRHSKCGRSSVAEHQLPKLNMRVRFPSPAPAASCRSQVANLTMVRFAIFISRVFGVGSFLSRQHSGVTLDPRRGAGPLGGPAPTEPAGETFTFVGCVTFLPRVYPPASDSCAVTSAASISRF